MPLPLTTRRKAVDNWEQLNRKRHQKHKLKLLSRDQDEQETRWRLRAPEKRTNGFMGPCRLGAGCPATAAQMPIPIGQFGCGPMDGRGRELSQLLPTTGKQTIACQRPAFED